MTVPRQEAAFGERHPPERIAGDSSATSDYRRCAARFSSGDACGVQLLRDRPDSATIRACLVGRRSVVMKLWDRSGWRAVVRRCTRTTPAWREWLALVRLHAAKVPVPCPVARFSLPDGTGRFSDVLVIEDLGEVTTSLQRIKDACSVKDTKTIASIDEQIINITAQMLEARVVDPDHSMMNFLCTGAGQAVRIDLELARTVRSVRLNSTLLCRMMSRLLTSYVYATQPHCDRAGNFAESIAARLDLPARIRRTIKASVDVNLENQRRSIGVDSCLPVRW